MSKVIPLTKGYETIVDDLDYEVLSKKKWCVSVNKQGYVSAVRHDMRHGKCNRIYMHRHLLNAGVGFEVDHINRNSLDNRRENLRLATSTQNKHNTPRRLFICGKPSSSQYKGVSLHSKGGSWVSRIRVNGKRLHLGMFKNEVDAAIAYDNAARVHFGEFAFLNFPDTITKEV